MDDNQVQGQTIDERIAAATAEPSSQPAVEDVKTQPEPTPSSDQNPTEEPVKEPVPEGAEPEYDAAEKEALANSKNPERTRTYIEKLKAELAEAKKATTKPTQPEPEYGSSVFDQFHAPETASVAPTVAAPDVATHQVDQIRSQFISEDGTVDIDGFNRAIQQAQREAYEAKAQTRTLSEKIARFEETQQVKEAHTAHPELDPLNREKFDPGFYNLVKDRLLRNMWEGKEEPLVKVASELKAYYKPPQQPVNQDKIATEAVERYKEAQKDRIQGPIEQGKGADRNPEVSLEELRAKTRLGDDNALSTRLKALGI